MVISSRIDNKAKNDAVLYFTISSLNGFTLLNFDFLTKKLTKRLTAKCQELGIEVEKWQIYGLGATGDGSILEVLTSFYYANIGWFVVLKIIGVLPILKKITRWTVYSITEVFCFFRKVSYRIFHHKNCSDLTPGIAIWVRVEIDRSKSINSVASNLISARQSFYELILVLPILEEEVAKLIPGIAVEFHTTVKIYDPANDPVAIEVVRYKNQDFYKRRLSDFLLHISSKQGTHRVIFTKSGITNRIKIRKERGINII